jgi:hypothetical protein
MSDYDKLAVLQKLTQQANQQQSYLDNKEAQLNQMQNNLNAGVVPTSSNGGQGLQANLQNNLPYQLLPGNLGDINSVIWPFQFSTGFQIVNPQTNVPTSYTITQEACFVWMSYVKVVYSVDVSGNLTYIDPNQAGSAGQAYNLSFTIFDTQSQRNFQNVPTDVNTVGHPRWPTKFPRAMLFLPNSNIQISWTNSDPANIYAPYLIALGYRMRVQDAQNILSLIHA